MLWLFRFWSSKPIFFLFYAKNDIFFSLTAACSFLIGKGRGEREVKEGVFLWNQNDCCLSICVLLKKWTDNRYDKKKEEIVKRLQLQTLALNFVCNLIVHFFYFFVHNSFSSFSFLLFYYFTATLLGFLFFYL